MSFPFLLSNFLPLLGSLGAAAACENWQYLQGESTKADGVGGRASGEVASREAVINLLELALHTPDWQFRWGAEEKQTVAWRMEERTHVKVGAIRAKWSGLRTFTPDRIPAVGYALDSEGFFWLAGQGGAGLQTAPALSEIAAALVERRTSPLDGIDPAALDPDRFLRKPA